MSPDISKPPEFVSSSFCHVGGCVGVATRADESREMRDTKESSGPVLRFTKQEWSAFVACIKSGEFDYSLRSA